MYYNYLSFENSLLSHSKNVLTSLAASVFFFFNFIFRLYITVLVLPNIKMNAPQVYMCSPSVLSWALGIFGLHCSSRILVTAGDSLSCSMWDLLFPDQGSNPGPLHWEPGVLATGLPGKSHLLSHFCKLIFAVG